MKKSDLIKVTALFILAVIAYIPAFVWMVERWSAAETYYSHGFLVPFISAFIVWTKRRELSALKISPQASGWIFFLGSIVVHLICTRFRISFMSGLSFIPVLAGLVLLSLGRSHLKKLLFPISFLIFMVPMPMVLIANVSFRLKIFAAQVSTVLINGVGVKAVRDGSVIKTAHSFIMVEDPCSGIRSLIALIALGALMAYFNDISRKRKIALFISSIPIAISTNIIRITALSLATEIYGDKFAGDTFHTIMGVMVFILAFIGLTLVAKLLE